MNREQILRLNRNSQQDEGFIHAANQGRMIASGVLCLLETILILFNWITGQPNNIPLCLLFAMLAADTTPHYRFTGQKRYLMIALASGAASVAFLLAHMIRVVMMG